MNKPDMTFFGALKLILTYALTIALFFIVVEGFSSLAISTANMLDKPPLPNPRHYDEDLGWTSIPNSYSAHYYGPGKFVHTNAQGFRNEADTAPVAAAGKVRVVCSGDSFTYGLGVANDRTWCHRLSELDSRFETVNLGQPGYGVDQAYLRYRKDGHGLNHAVHIFAFVSGNFNRIATAQQRNFGKPVLELNGDELDVGNVPVPRFRWTISRAAERGDFRSIDFARRVLSRLSSETFEMPDANRIKPIAARVFESIQEQDFENGITSVFVFLPTRKDIDKDRAWRTWVTSTMYERSLPFVDLTTSLRSIPPAESASFFIADGLQGAGHYNEAGNGWAARELYGRLIENPRIAALLEPVVARQGKLARQQ